MPEKKTDLQILDRLRDQIDQLQSEPPLGPAFQIWRAAVLRSVDDIYGSNSRERSEFEQIRFKISPALKEKTQDAIAALGVPSLETGNYYKERLHEAKEFLLGLILALRA